MLMHKKYQSILKWDLSKPYIQNVWHIYLIGKNIAPTKYHNTNRSTRQTLWKKSSINSNFFKFNDSQYVYLCKTYGHTYVKPKHSNPPNLIRRLPIWATTSRSPDFTNILLISKVFTIILFSCQTADNDKKTLSSLLKSTIFVIIQPVYPHLSARRTV